MAANRKRAVFSVVVAVLLFGVGHYWNIVRTEWSTKMSSKVPSEVYHVAAPKDNRTDQLKVTNSTELPLQVINGVKKFVMFAGNGRTGTSITASLMDAHPHVIISNQYGIFKNLPKLTKAASHNHKSLKETLFNALYAQSKDNAIHARKELRKGVWKQLADYKKSENGDKYNKPANILTWFFKGFLQHGSLEKC